LIGEQEAIERLVRHLERLEIPYMVAGSVASSHHGRPRATNDADVVIDPTAQTLDLLVAALSADGYYVDPQVARRALAARRPFNVIDPDTAFKIDLIVRKERPFSREEFARRVRREVAGLSVQLATAEDTILAKLEWARKAGGSERQLDDVAGILQVSGAQLDRAYIERWAESLGVADLWQEIVRESGPARP
jgi:hypothetical protein